MAARAAFVFTFLVLGIVQLLRLSAPAPTPQFYTVGFAPTTTSQPRQISPYMMAPKTKNLHKIEIDEFTKSELLRYLDSSDLHEIQRTVLVSLLRIHGRRSELQPSMEDVLADPSGEAAILAAAYEVFFIARDVFGGPVKDFVDRCMKHVMLTTKDNEKRVEILDTCFRAFPAEYKDTPVEDSMRLFRMLLRPESANVATAKQEVRTFTAKLNRDTAKSVERWMQGTEAGKPEFLGPSDFAEDCLTVGWDVMDLWMPIMPRKKHGAAQTANDCFLFEESMRNYKAAVTDLQEFDL
jgi:hypothetical protein